MTKALIRTHWFPMQTNELDGFGRGQFGTPTYINISIKELEV